MCGATVLGECTVLVVIADLNPLRDPGPGQVGETIFIPLERPDDTDKE